MIQGFASPIPKSISDADELGDAYEMYNEIGRKYNIVPRYGKELGYSMLLLDITNSLARLSTSHVACKTQKAEWTIGNQLDIKRDVIPGLIEGDDDFYYENGIIYPPKKESVGRDEKIRFAKKLETYGINFMSIASITRSMESEQLGDVSSAFLLIRVVKVGGVKKVYFKQLHYLHTKIIDTGGKRGLMVMHSPTYNDILWGVKSNKPKIYRMSVLGKEYNWTHRANYSETVLHISRGQNTIYGSSPITESILYPMYNEVVLSETTSKIVGSEFVTKAMLFFEGVNRNPSKNNRSNGFANVAQGIRNIIETKQGYNSDTGSSIAIAEYAKGNKAPELLKLGINRDTAWVEVVKRISTDKIYSVNNWHAELTGAKSFKSGLGSNMLLDLYVTTDIKVIRPKQQFWEQTWSSIFNNIGLVLGEKFDYTIKPIQQIQQMLYRMSMLKQKL